MVNGAVVEKSTKKIMELDQYKKNCFKVPENYFEQLEDEVLLKIRKSDAKLKRRKWYISIASAAASLLILVSIITFYEKPEQIFMANAVPFSENLALAMNDLHFLEETVLYEEPGITPAEITKITEVVSAENLEDIDYQIIESYFEDALSLETYYY